MLRVLDGIIPYLDAKDKLLIRFLSEIPEVNEKVLERVKGLARDPERVQLAVNSLLFVFFSLSIDLSE
jgi:symplekin